MNISSSIELAAGPVFITGELDARPSGGRDAALEKSAILDLALRMAEAPEEVLPRFVDLAMEIAGGVSAGLSLFEEGPQAGVFRWKYLRGALTPFEGALTPRNFSPCGVTLDENGPVLALHPERVYGWIAEAGIVVPEVLLVPLYIGGEAPLGTLWIVSEAVGHFHRAHARALAELATFVGIALKMVNTERQLHIALEEQAMLTKEMSHRVKNLFAVTDGMIRLSARTAKDKDEMARALSGRLHALASAHTLVSRHLNEVGHAPRATEIETLLRAVIAPHELPGAQDAARFALSGPPVGCGDRTINAVALIFHELATNAVKYGALSTPLGRVEVSWSVEAAELCLAWVEHGGPVVHPALAQGFGGALVGKTVTGQLGGSVDYDWAPDGLSVSFRLPLERLEA